MCDFAFILERPKLMTPGRAAHDLVDCLSEAIRTPVLTREEELGLARRYKDDGDTGAADTLARAHLRCVVAIARRYRGYGLSLGELIAEGNFGIAQALIKFDPERGVRFATYATHWIRACIISHVLKSWSLVGGGGALRSRVFFKLRRERIRAANALGEGEAADLMVAERLGTSTEEVGTMMMRVVSRDISLDAGSEYPGSIRLIDRLPAADNPEQGLSEHRLHESLARAIARAIAELDPRERYIAEHRLMADAALELSLAQIARHFGISRERARQLEVRTKHKLRARLPVLGDSAVGERICNG